MQSHIFYTANRERDMSPHQAFQQRSRCYHIDFRMLLIEVAQGLHCLRLILYLVDKNQGALSEIHRFISFEINSS